MLYRVRIDLPFKNKDDADQMLNQAKKLKAKAVDIIKDNYKEKRKIQLEECHHDEAIPKPCKILKEL